MDISSLLISCIVVAQQMFHNITHNMDTDQIDHWLETVEEVVYYPKKLLEILKFCGVPVPHQQYLNMALEAPGGARQVLKMAKELKRELQDMERFAIRYF